MGFNFSLSWFLVLFAFLIMCYLAYKAGPPFPSRLLYIAWALFFLSLLVSGFITMHASAGAHS